MIRIVIDSSDEEQSLNPDPQTLQIIAEETELDGRSMEILARYCNEELICYPGENHRCWQWCLR